MSTSSSPAEVFARTARGGFPLGGIFWSMDAPSPNCFAAKMRAALQRAGLLALVPARSPPLIPPA